MSSKFAGALRLLQGILHDIVVRELLRRPGTCLEAHCTVHVLHQIAHYDDDADVHV